MRALIILKILSSLKSKELNHDCARKMLLDGSLLSFFRGVHCSAKNVLKVLAFVFTPVANLSLPKEVELEELFCRYKMFSVLTNKFLLVIEDYSTFYQDFHNTTLL